MGVISWYFKHKKRDYLYAVTPRVASTSQRKLFEMMGFPRLTEDEARRLAAQGVPVRGVIREPFERVVSAYRRHRPGFVPTKFEDYVVERHSWDRHVMPQTWVHTREGVPVTEWILFQDLVTQVKFPHHNATPNEHLEQHDVSVTPRFLEWFHETYAEDYEVYRSLLAQR